MKNFLASLLKRLLLISGLTYVGLFLVFFFDLDGKFIYYVWEPLIQKRYDGMKHGDVTQMPYGAKAGEKE